MQFAETIQSEHAQTNIVNVIWTKHTIEYPKWKCIFWHLNNTFSSFQFIYDDKNEHEQVKYIIFLFDENGVEWYGLNTSAPVILMNAFYWPFTAQQTLTMVSLFFIQKKQRISHKYEL